MQMAGRDVGETGARNPKTGGGRRVTTETKSALKTTELIVFAATVAAVLIAGFIVDEADQGGLGARQVWLYVTILAVGYMISRGLAKSGSREPYDDH